MSSEASVSAAWAAIPRIISDISEDFYCAGWLIDAEFEVWRLMQEGGTWGMGAASAIPEDLGALRSIAESTGYWVRWDGNADPSTVPVPLDTWREMYATWAEARRLRIDAYRANRCGLPVGDEGTCAMDVSHSDPCFTHHLDALLWRSEQRAAASGVVPEPTDEPEEQRNG